MRTEVVTVPPELPLSELADVLLRHKIQGAPVVEDGRLVGIISRSDVVRQLKVEEERISDSSFYLEPFDADTHRAEDHESVLQSAASRMPKLCVRDMMIMDLVTVSPATPLEDVARRMLEERVHRVLVTEGGALRGILSSLDLVALFADGRVTLR
jgi:CBS domain-containing protein